MVGELLAGGKTVEQVRLELQARLKKYLSDPIATVIVTESKGNVVYVVGQVTKPGAITMNPTINVLQALSIAGGANPYAKLDGIIIIRSSGGTQRVLPFRYGQVSCRQGPGAEYSAGERRCRRRSVVDWRCGVDHCAGSPCSCARRAHGSSRRLPAAQFYVQPTVTLGAENDSNLDLDPGSNSSVQGYLANAGALFGIATPNDGDDGQSAGGLSRLSQGFGRTIAWRSISISDPITARLEATPRSAATSITKMTSMPNFHRRISTRSTRFSRPTPRPVGR